MKLSLSSSVVLLTVLAATVSVGYGLTVMSVDFGAEFMKIAVVAPGVPMEIALNKESKRKTPVAIAFRDGERTFGDDAITAGMRSPSMLFTQLLHLLGKPVTHPIVEAYRLRYPHHNIQPYGDRGTVSFQISDTESYTVEELVAQLLSHARAQASAHTAQPVKDLVITVPAFFNQAERRALLDAAAIAGLKVLSLMSSNAAVSLNYGMFRRKEINATAQYLLFYDMGSSQTTATVVAYQTVKTKEKGYSETNPQLTVLGVGYDRTLGGYEMQLRLRDFLAQKFNDQKKTSSDVFANPRAMGKINKEAARLKRVLSANSEHVSQIENVMEDIDLRVLVKRTEFEEMVLDLVQRSWGPVNDALVAAGLDMSVLDQLLLVGGATRIPAVQEVLQSHWGRELSRNINADEAGALGAVYRAADIGQGFKVKTFHVKESNLYPIEVEFDRSVEQADGSRVERVVKRSLFAVGNLYPQKKVITFNKHTADFDFRVNYGDMTEYMTSSKIREQFGSSSSGLSLAGVTGVDETYSKHLAVGGTEFKGIKAHFSLDASGILRLGDVEMVMERNVTVEEEPPKAGDGLDLGQGAFSKIGSTLSKLFGGDDDAVAAAVAAAAAAANATEGDSEAAAADPAAADAPDSSNSGNDTKADKEKTEKKTKIVTEKLLLNITEVLKDIPALAADGFKESVDKLSAINSLEAERELRAVGRNALETLLLDIRDKMTRQEYRAASVQGDQSVLTDKCDTLEDWLYEDGFDASAATYDQKVAELQKVFGPIASRVEQHRDRPAAIEVLLNMMNRSSEFLQHARAAKDADGWFTTVELQNLDDLIVDTQRWLEEADEAQAALEQSEDPSLSLHLIGEKIGDMEREMKYLVNKAKMARIKADREAAEAKVRAEKEAKEAERRRKKKEKEAEGSNATESGAQVESGAAAEATTEEAEPQPDGQDSRLEPELPEDTEDTGEDTEDTGEDTEDTGEDTEDTGNSERTEEHREL